MNVSYYYKQLKKELLFLPKSLNYSFTRKKRAIYIGCTGHDNLGDEAILIAIKRMLKKKIYLYDILYTKPSSGKYYRKIFINSPEYIILGGGTLIRKGANESYLKLLIEYCKKYPKAKLLIIGSGVGNKDFSNQIGFPTDTISWRDILNKSEFISVRGKLSKKELIDWGVEKEVNILHDPAIWFAKDTVKLKSKRKKIGLNFANIGDRIYGQDKTVIEKFAFEFVTLLKQNNWDIFLYPTTRSDTHYMMETIGLKSISGLKIYEDYKDINTSLDFLENLDLFVGQRLHSVIFSTAVTTPFFALEYEPKCRDYLSTIDMLSHSKKVDQLDTKEIYDKVVEIYLNLDAEQEALHEKKMIAMNAQAKCIEKFLSNI